jgi:predicted RNA-binding protein with PUA-like domain
MKYWLVKSEPETYSLEDLQKEGHTVWDGIRNYQARNFLKEMNRGDKVLFYHSGKEKSVEGIAEVSKEFFPESGDPKDTWVAVEIKYLKSLQNRVTLQKIRESENLQNIMLVKQGRLSVMPLSSENYNEILDMSKSE